MAHTVLRAGELEAVVGDNAAHGEHRAGYNGVWSLRHASCPRSLFTPSSGGLNLEHVFDAETDDHATDVFFEPRHAPMELRQLSDSAAELHQPSTPVFGMESWTRFSLAAPHYVDVRFRCFPRRAPAGGFVGLFWASYIDGPDDKSLYFLGDGLGVRDSWTQLCTQWHYDQSTVRSREDTLELALGPAKRESLFRSVSPLRYDLPLTYGRFEDHVWIAMFAPGPCIRLAHSPSGGGGNPERRTTNPAWDFQLIVPGPVVGAEYGFSARFAFRPWTGREDVLEEWRRWVDE